MPGLGRVVSRFKALYLGSCGQVAIVFGDREALLYRMDGTAVNRPKWMWPELEHEIKVAIDSLSDRLDRAD
jgi:hypothetical protein